MLRTSTGKPTLDLTRKPKILARLTYEQVCEAIALYVIQTTGEPANTDTVEFEYERDTDDDGHTIEYVTEAVIEIRE